MRAKSPSNPAAASSPVSPEAGTGAARTGVAGSGVVRTGVAGTGAVRSGAAGSGLRLHGVTGTGAVRSGAAGSGLRLHGVTVRRGEIVALDDVDVHLPAGAITLLWGGNGSGKTTMLLALAGCLEVEGGHIDGLAGQQVALVPQAPPTPERLPLTVRAAVEMGCWPGRGLLAGLTAQDRQRVQEAMEVMRIADLAGRQLSRVSGGQRQRALVAQALVRRAPILLADEPTAAADVASTEIIHRVLREEADRGAVVVVASHDPEVRELADHVVEMRAGRIVN